MLVENCQTILCEQVRFLINFDAVKKRIILSVTNDLATDQRVQKVAQTLIDMGAEVCLVGRKLKGSMPVPKFEHHRMRLLFNKGVAFYAEYHIRLFLLLLFKRADILVANDLDTLLPNYLVSKLKGVQLVYDSHEYFTEVPELQGSPLKKKIWLSVERFVFPKLKNIFTVNISIANIYRQLYQKDIHVLRNVPRRNVIHNTNRIELRKKLGLPLDKKIIILQGSGINVSRGGEEAVAAMMHTNNSMLYIIGSGDALPTLKKMVRELQLDKRVVFMAKLPYAQLQDYTACADAGLTLDKDNNLNYRYSLPNKLFDYFACGIPVIASSLIEIERIHQQYNFGILLKEVTPHTVAEAINSINPDADIYQSWRKTVAIAAENLCWENEEKIIQEVYKKLL
jgi:glycosyltransferase involved in cell wall biosynthesis